MKLRKDGWPETSDDGPIVSHSNHYVGFVTRAGNFVSQRIYNPITGKHIQRWLDQQALARVRDRKSPPISYYDAVLEVQLRSDPYQAVTYAEAHERNVRVDNMRSHRLSQDNLPPTVDVWIRLEDGGGAPIEADLLRSFTNEDDARLFLSQVVDLLADE